nr:methyltransferase [Otariodibacter sp.]
MLSAIFSIVLTVLSLIAFYQKKSSLDPIHLDKTIILVTHSIYRISRNPMYLSLALLLIGWSLWLANLLGLIVV